MKTEEWINLLEIAIISKLEEIDTDRKLKILDVGIFPWHGLIELSTYYENDDTDGNCYIDDIASWPAYNFSAQREGEWPDIEALC